MSKKLYETIEITDLKDMLNKTKDIYADKIAYKVRDGKDGYLTFTHKQVRQMVDSLGTALIDMGLKGKLPIFLLSVEQVLLYHWISLYQKMS